MITQQKQLQSVLQALALPVTGQLRLYPSDECKVNRLIQEYDRVEPIFLADWTGYLTAAQEAVLLSLRHELMMVCREADHACTDLALRRSAGWRRVRMQARLALLTFDWPMALPPHFERVMA